MYKINFQSPIHIHFIGIGGISMSGLAEVLLKEKFHVSGSDSRASELTEKLSENGAEIFIGQRASNIKPSTDLVVYTAAIHGDNPEWKAAQERNLPMLSRAELLGQIMDHFQKSIAVSGTHGKTTTTSMLTHILLAAGADPTVSVGGILNVINGNIRVGNSDVFLTEACEYTNSFLNFRPRYSIILNIEADHLDFFKDLADIRHSFHLFAQNTKENGCLFLNSAIEKPEYITDGLSSAVITYGLNGSEDYSASAIQYDSRACASFDLMHQGTPIGHIHLNVPGEHNISNALAAASCAVEMGIPVEAVLHGLEDFGGTGRRFEYKGTLGGITIVDDYAHHPTEILATLKAARKFQHGRLVCVFQPHTYTRTKALWDGFVDSLSHADIVVLTDVYAARETDTLGIHIQELANQIAEKGTECYYFPCFDETESFLLKKCINNDLLITMGAGDVYKIGEHLLGR